MANVFQQSGYRVHCIFSQSFANVYKNHIGSIDPATTNWMLHSGARFFESIVDDTGGPISVRDIIGAIKAIKLNGGDQIAVYVRSHGCYNARVGLMDGIIVWCGDIVRAVKDRGDEKKKFEFL